MERARLALLGLSVGDAFGQCFFLPASMARRALVHRSLPEISWPYTDDTEMALSIFEILGARGGIDQDRLAEAFARRFDPRRGYGGMAQVLLRAIGGGEPWRQASYSAFAGQGSMGNGGAMRVAPVGAYFADDLERAAAEARLSAEVTHAHPEGQAGAIAVAVAAALAWQQRDQDAPDPREFLRVVAEHTPPGETHDKIVTGQRLPPYVGVTLVSALLGNGSRVTAPDTVPFCIWCAAYFSHSYEEALWQTVSVLGDRDTNCAIVGGIVALATGARGIPAQWVRSRESLPEV